MFSKTVIIQHCTETMQLTSALILTPKAEEHIASIDNFPNILKTKNISQAI